MLCATCLCNHCVCQGPGLIHLDMGNGILCVMSHACPNETSTLHACSLRITQKECETAELLLKVAATLPALCPWSDLRQKFGLTCLWKCFRAATNPHLRNLLRCGCMKHSPQESLEEDWKRNAIISSTTAGTATSAVKQESRSGLQSNAVAMHQARNLWTH